MRRRRYPKIHIQSKNDLAKQIRNTRTRDEQKLTLNLVNDVVKNFDNYWHDHPTQSKEGKWVRDASRTKLGRILDLINKRVLAINDDLLPAFIFGGISKRNNKQAASYLNGEFKKQRTLLKIDITQFFEQIHDGRVEQFFAGKCKCSKKGAQLLAKLCCVSYGPKENSENHKTIARGFATSSRLAVWCNLDNFLNLERLVKKELRGKEPRIAIYVDDIGITASKVSKDEMMSVYEKVKEVFAQDAKQKLPLNEDKTCIIYHYGEAYDKDGKLLPRKKWGFEFGGIQIKRNSLAIGKNATRKLDYITHRWKNQKQRNDSIKKSRVGSLRYKRYIES